MKKQDSMERGKAVLRVMSVVLILFGVFTLASEVCGLVRVATEFSVDAPEEHWAQIGLTKEHHSEDSYHTLKNQIRRTVYLAIVAAMLESVLVIWIGARGIGRSRAVGVSNGRFFMLWGVVLLLLFGRGFVSALRVEQTGLHAALYLIVVIIAVSYIWLGKKLRYGY